MAPRVSQPLDDVTLEICEQANIRGKDLLLSSSYKEMQGDRNR